MTKRTWGLALATVLLMPALTHAQIPATAPAATATTAPKRNAKRLQGKVTAIDTAKRTITVSTRRDPVGVTATLTADAKVYVQRPAVLTDLKAGDKVTVYGRDIAAGATTVPATRLVIQAAGADAGKKKTAAQTGYHKNSVDGAVASTAPALTVTTPGGVTVTVQTTADTKVAKVVLGTLSDVTVGTTVQVRTTGDAAAPTATGITVTPASAGANRRAGGKKRTRKSGQAPAATAQAPAATAPAAP